jgi:DNA-binding SARP family transcriptional activator
MGITAVQAGTAWGELLRGMFMEIRMLGPFEVFSDGGAPITPSAPKLRRVLQLLALHRGRVVRTDQITAELWDDRPPPSANTTLQTYIYQLRKLLSGAGEQDGTVATTPAGYVLRLPRAAIDAELFEELIAEGRHLLAGGRLAEGVEQFDRALAMWRGSMLATADVGPVLQVEVVRLDELRKSVVEERIGAALQLGRHRQLIGDLTGLVAEDPTHEGLQAKLMLALYRSGRRAEALAAYRGAQRVLADELGLEPCPELRQLHRRMLAADPGLDQPAPAGLVTLVSTEPPSQLPPDTVLLGRDRELETIRRALAAGGRTPVVAVDGPPGVGKSALCVHAACQVRGEFRDGQLWAELTTAEGDPVAPGDVLAEFLRAAGFPEVRIPDGTVERARMFRSWTADRKVLVVLDDVASPDQLTPLLPSGS